MKHLSILYFALLSFCISAQEKTTHAIKIYVEDAETGKNIDDAKVTLEGFEIPAITAKYDTKNRYYYFNEIPSGYNTVMSYHKKYNEKGFQNVAGLPEELKLQLHTPFRVKIPSDSNHFYKEDDYRIYILFNDTILNTLKTCPDFDSKSLCLAKEYIMKFHKNLIVKDELSFGTWGLNTIVVKKKNKKKFKRFNDLEIKKIATDKNILAVYAILMLTKDEKKTYFDQDGTPKYIPKYIKYIHCDTLTNNYKSNPSLAIETIKASEVSQQGKRNNSSSNIYSDFKEKLKNGLIKNNVYERNKKEIDVLSNSDQIRISNGELLDNFNNSDTIVVSCQKLKTITSIPTDPNYLKQYIATSDILSYNEINNLSYKNDKFYYQINYDLNDILEYKKEKFLIDLKETTNNEIQIYKLNNNIASPLGTMDLIEYYNLLGIKAHQKIEKNIKR
ncbi:hypothetical protein OIU83_10700 [Flavobacterium sp. LS1R49]|uniref:Carboxypeptidase regulatory-like domain-containing protein n=1 Tax=Flavobacterium shii TaxID=2987687 RepID=A0A9X2ZEW9_9FLAO|nr:hypothetical protein [Flavobacterium shii]MCV9928125.1 hypothetical protein [Flavobacterium shii]